MPCSPNEGGGSRRRGVAKIAHTAISQSGIGPLVPGVKKEPLTISFDPVKHEQARMPCSPNRSACSTQGEIELSLSNRKIKLQ